MKISSNYFQLSSVRDSWSEGLLILMYHSVDVPPLWHRRRGLYVTPGLLARQIRELQAAGIEFTSLGDWNKQRGQSQNVALTFDDACLNLFLNGLPVLQKLGVRAITYVVVSHISKWNAWDDNKGMRHEPLMDQAQLQEWLQAGHEIGSHGLTHCDLTKISLDEARREIIDSKKKLEDMFGREIRHFCYPYGAFNQTVREIVQEAGYETATSTIAGFNTADTDALMLARLLARHRRPYLTALTGL